MISQKGNERVYLISLSLIRPTFCLQRIIFARENNFFHSKSNLAASAGFL